MEWCEVIGQLSGSDEQRLGGLSLLQGSSVYADLEEEQVERLVAALVSLAKDSNYEVCMGALVAMQDLADTRPHVARETLNDLVPVVVNRLGLAQEGGRKVAIRTLLAFMAAGSPAEVLQYAQHVWAHKNWRVKAGMIEMVAGMSRQCKLSQEELQTAVVTPLAALTGDPNSHVKELALAALKGLHDQLGDELPSLLDTCNIDPGQREDIEEYFRPSAASLDGQSAVEAGSEASFDSQPRNHPDSPRVTIRTEAACISSSSGVAGTASKPSRRGGFQDGGGIAAGSDWPAIVPIAVQSERDLRMRVEQIISSLDAKVDWNKRVEALVLLEGLVLGGAAEWDGFSEAVRVLREPLRFQLNDRRSAVSKQACHLLATLAREMGFQMEKQAIDFLPELFKILVISVQVMAEAADICASSFVRYCHSHRLLPIICNAICTDRNAKLRQICTAYLFQALESWDRQDYERCIEIVERALVSASQDALNETRAAARLMFGAYAVAWPERVSAVLNQLDLGLQAKLRQAALSYIPGPAAIQQSPQPPQMRRLSSGGGQAKSPAPSHQLVGSPPARKVMQQAKTPPRKVHRGSMLPLQVMKSPERETPQAQMSRRHKSIAGTALRVSAGDSSCYVAASLESLRLDNQKGEPPALPARRVTADQGHGPANLAYAGQESVARRASAPGYGDFFRSQATPSRPSASRPQASQRPTGAGALPPLSGAAYGRAVAAQQQLYDSGAGQFYSERLQWLANEPKAPVHSATEILQSARAGAGNWQDKLELLAKIRALAAADPGDLASPAHAEKIADILIEQSGHPHNKVAVTALEAIHELLPAIPEFWSGQRLWRLIPHLLLRTVDVRDAVRKAASNALADFGASSGVAGLLPGLVQTLKTSKAPKVVCACLRCFLDLAEAGMECDSATTSTMRSWQAQLEKLAKDRNADIRQLASLVLQALVMPPGCDFAPSPGSSAKSSPAGRLSAAKVTGASSPGQNQLASAAYASRSQASLRQPSMAERFQGIAVSGEESNKSEIESSQALLPSAVQRRMDGVQSGAGNPDSPLHHASSSTTLSGIEPERQAVTAASRAAVSLTEAPEQPPGHTHSEANGAVTRSLARIPSIGQEGAGRDRIAEQPLAAQHPQIVELRAMAMRDLERCSSGTSSDSIEFFDAIADPGQQLAEPQHSPQVTQHRMTDADVAAVDDTPEISPAKNKSGKNSAFEDTEALVHKLQQCIVSIGHSPSLEQLSQLGAVIHTIPTSCIQAFNVELIDIVLAALRATDVIAHGGALLMLVDLLGKENFMVEALLSALQLVTCLLACSASSSSQVRKLAEEALQLLTERMPGPVAMEVLLASLPKCSAEDAAGLGPSMQAAIKAISRVLSRLPEADIRQVLEPALLPALLHAVSHTSAEVRKAAVFCLVDLWLLFGEPCMVPLLKPLNAGQMKLITIYAARAAEKRQQGHMAS